MRMKQKKFKMADSKKRLIFQNRQFSKIFYENFSEGVLGLVGLNDAKGIDVAQRIWP